MRIASFVSSHGFGHAARACAVLQAFSESVPGLEIDIYTETPKPFFTGSLTANIRYYPMQTDVGLRQLTPLLCDIEGSQKPILDFLQFDESHMQFLVDRLKSRGTALIHCDISPYGLKIAEMAAIPSVLVDNFTWDWIYASYTEAFPDYLPLIQQMQEINATADYRIRTRPVCGKVEDGHHLTDPLARIPRRKRSTVRQTLGVSGDDKLVLLTQGGIAADTPFLQDLKKIPAVHFLVTGSQQNKIEDNLHLLKNDASLYLPDYLNACDAVAGKVGYSTVAEVWRAGLPMLYFTRNSFRESASLANFIDSTMSGIGFAETDYISGVWLDSLDQLLAYKRRPPEDPDKGLREVTQILRGITSSY